MPNINLWNMYNQKKRKFGVNDSDRFRGSFVDAVNNVYSEMNDQVFQSETLSLIDSFDDIIDERLAGFTDLTYDDGTGINDAISDREFWSVEYEFERMSDTNGFTDDIDDDNGNVIISITNGVVTIAGDSVVASGTLQDVDVFTLKFVSASDGNALYQNGSEIPLDYGISLNVSGSTIAEITDGYYALADTGFSSATVFKRYQLVSGGLTYTLQYQFTSQNEWQLEITDGATKFLVYKESSEDSTTVPTFDDANKSVQIGFTGDSPDVTNEGFATGNITQSIGSVSSHVISGVSGLELTRTRFLSAATVVYDFPINEGTGTALTDLVGGYTATLTGETWEARYVEPSSSLSTRYRSPFDAGLDYHLQDGGEWAIEPEQERERKWYNRGIRQARNILQDTTTYTNPLGI